MLAGSQEAYAVEVRMKGFDIGDGNAIHKENKILLEKIVEQGKGQGADIAAMKAGLIKLEGL